MELVNEVCLLLGVSLVDGEKKRTPGLAQQPNQFQVGPGERRAAVDHHDDRSGFIESDPGLTKDFRRNEIFVIRNNAASVDDADAPPAPLCIAIEAVTSNARLVADNRAPRADDAIEQRGL